MKTEPIAEEQLDDLLNAFFLQENGGADVAAARFVLAQQYDVAIDPEKERELLARLSGRSGGAWKMMLGVFVVLLLSAGIFFIIDNNRADSGIAAGGNPGDGSSSVTAPAPAGSSAEARSEKKDSIPAFAASAAPKKFPPFFSSPDAAPPALPPTAVPLTTTYFSEAEFAAYNRLKLAMLEKIIGIDEHLYTRVEEGKVKYGKRTLPVDAFVIRNYAITNREYKSFLADLVKNGRAADYNAAMVRSEGWSDHNCPTLAEEYFEEEQYNDFPVVNVSREAALLYCAWLEKQLNDLAKAKNPKARTLKVRLPYDHEWIYTAKVGYAEIPNCSGYNTIYDPREGLVDKTFLRRIAQVKKADKSTATPMDALFALNRYGLSEKEVLNIFDQGLRYRPADTLYPAGIAALSKAGHVSEMISDLAGKGVVMGSCWKSKEEYLEMMEVFNKRSGSPYVGFRVVITGAEKGSYKDPFW